MHKFVARYHRSNIRNELLLICIRCASYKLKTCMAHTSYYHISFQYKSSLQKKRAIPAQAYRRFGPKRLYETHTGVFVPNAYLKTPLGLARSSRHISRVSISAFWSIGNAGMFFKYKKKRLVGFLFFFFKQPHLGVLPNAYVRLKYFLTRT